MKYLAVILWASLATSAAYAQTAPQLPPPQQQQQARIDPYTAQPYYPPQPQVQPVQPTPVGEQHPWEYGHSVMTDIRQMNF